MTELRALTLWQPWASVVALGLKPIENRPWAPWPSIVGKRIAIHAGKKWDPCGEEMIRRLLPEFDLDRARVFSAILGSVVVGQGYEKGSLIELTNPPTPWAFGPWCWPLSGALALDAPIPMKGALGLWRVPEEIAETLTAANPPKETP